jgi:hypothetical protein
MNVTTAPQPERGRAHARLHAHLDALDRLDPDRPTAIERLVEAIGAEFARKLLLALSAGGGHRGGFEFEAA